MDERFLRRLTTGQGPRRRATASTMAADPDAVAAAWLAREALSERGMEPAVLADEPSARSKGPARAVLQAFGQECTRLGDESLSLSDRVASAESLAQTHAAGLPLHSDVVGEHAKQNASSRPETAALKW